MVITRTLLVKACVLCVEIGMTFVLTSIGDECVPNYLQASDIIDHAEFKSECDELHYHRTYPNITDPLEVTTMATTDLPMDPESRCIRCVWNGLKFMKTTTGFVCLAAYGEWDSNLVIRRAETPSRCRLTDWDQYEEPSTVPPPTTTTLQPQISFGAVTGFMVLAVLMVMGMIAAGTFYIRKYVIPRNRDNVDEDALGMAYFRNMMFNPDMDVEGRPMVNTNTI